MTIYLIFLAAVAYFWLMWKWDKFTKAPYIEKHRMWKRAAEAERIRVYELEQALKREQLEWLRRQNRRGGEAPEAPPGTPVRPRTPLKVL